MTQVFNAVCDLFSKSFIKAPENQNADTDSKAGTGITSFAADRLIFNIKDVFGF